jgi:hypothetical protein
MTTMREIQPLNVDDEYPNNTVINRAILFGVRAEIVRNIMSNMKYTVQRNQVGS